MWRAFLFDEPELARYLEIGRRHKARLVRDAATLIDELRAGRNELGTITDVRARLAAFRALDLDPRRAEQRKAEAEERAQVEASRTRRGRGGARRACRGPRGAISRGAGSTTASRTARCSQKLDAAPITAAQIAALDELRRPRATTNARSRCRALARLRSSSGLVELEADASSASSLGVRDDD